MTTISGYSRFGGVHAETATIANCLAAQGVTAPHTGAAWSEALLFGIGGGLGAGYILWEFKAHHAKVLVFGWNYRWNYPVEYQTGLCERIGVTAAVVEGSARAGQRALEETLAAGKPAIVYLDRENLPHRAFNPALDGSMGCFGVVCGMDGDTVTLDDLAARPFHVSLTDLTRARSRISSYKNRMITLTPPATPVDVAAAVRAGIQACIGYLGGTSDSFALPVIRKWARMMTDSRNAKGWPVVFADGSGLVPALASVYENIDCFNTSRGALRLLYADFLDEAASILNTPGLREVGTAYRALAGSWSALAASALEAHSVLRETRALIDARYAALARGDAGVADALKAGQEQTALQSVHRRASPLDAAAQNALFAHMGAQIQALYEGEVAALEKLKAALA